MTADPFSGFDPTTDTPIEILHTILLGILKYIWYDSHSKWKEPEQAQFALRLQSMSSSGLSIPPVRANYIMQYANSLIGRQLKQVGQLGIFCDYDIIKPELLVAWKAVRESMPLLWYPEINESPQYQVCSPRNSGHFLFTDVIGMQIDLDIAIANVLDSIVSSEPSRITTKNKMHVLSHAPDDVRN